MGITSCQLMCRKLSWKMMLATGGTICVSTLYTLSLLDNEINRLHKCWLKHGLCRWIHHVMHFQFKNYAECRYLPINSQHSQLHHTTVNDVIKDSRNQHNNDKDKSFMTCNQHVYFWGNRMNLPFGFDIHRPMDKPFHITLSRDTTCPYLEDTGPQYQGHFSPHASRWFDTHQFGWAGLSLGSHFGAAWTQSGDVYIWGSFIPPIVLGPSPIIPMGDNPLITDKTIQHVPHITMVLHQSVGIIPCEQRVPSYPETRCIEQGEIQRVFVGPIKLNLNFKAKDVKTGVNKMFILSTSGQVYCHVDLINELHWIAFENYLVPFPPIHNPYKTSHSVVIDMGQRNKKNHEIPQTLTSMLPNQQKTSLQSSEITLPITNDTTTSIIKTNDSSGNDLRVLNQDGQIEMIPEVARNEHEESELFTHNTPMIPTRPLSKTNTNHNLNDMKEMTQHIRTLQTILGQNVQWKERSKFFLLNQLPQPGYIWGKGIQTIAVGYDHLACLTYTGELFCMGDNTFGQCGVNPHIKGQQSVGLQRVRHPQMTQGRLITSIACGHKHTAFQDDLGVLYTFGDDSKLQLGLGDTRQEIGLHLTPTSQPSLAWNANKSSPIQSVVEYGILQKHQIYNPVPTMIPTELRKNLLNPPDQLVCGGYSTCIRYITSPFWLENIPATTDMFCCGDNVRGLCGSDEFLSQQPFRRVKLPIQFEIIAMSCGLNHCVAFLSNGELFGWGDNRCGQTGHKQPKKIACPKVIRLEMPTKKQQQLRKAMRSNYSSPSSTSVTETYQSKGLVADFKDETTHLQTLHDKEQKEKKEYDSIMKSPLLPETNVLKNTPRIKPIPRFQTTYSIFV